MKKEELERLRAVFNGHREIKLAYLFGSRAGRSCGPLSDYDFAVYFGGIKKSRMLSLKLDLIGQISRILHSDKIDVVILNLAESPDLKFAVLKEGVLIHEKEPFKVMVEPRIMSEYFDFHKMLSKHGLTRALS